MAPPHSWGLGLTVLALPASNLTWAFEHAQGCAGIDTDRGDFGNICLKEVIVLFCFLVRGGGGEGGKQSVKNVGRQGKYEQALRDG
jgi:hypothetical protein